MMFKSLLSFTLLSLLYFTVQAQNNVVADSLLWQPNGKVNKLKVMGDTLIIAGDFNMVGPNTPYASGFDANGAVIANFPHTNGEVTKAIADNKGGLYIAGEFTKIGNQSRGGMAYIDSNGAVTSFFKNRAISGRVYDMQLKDSNLYIAGDFTGTNEYTGGGALTQTNSVAIDFSFPKVEGVVYASIPDGKGGIYIGGKFTNVGEYERANLAHIDKNGQVTPWNPGTDAEVWSLAMDEKHIFVGGKFTYAGCYKRSKLAVFEINSSVPNGWDYSSAFGNTHSVFTLLVYGGKLFAGTGVNYDELNSFGYSTSSGIYGINRSTGALVFSKASYADVHAIEAGPGYLFVGGDLYVSGASLKKLIRVDTTNGNETTALSLPSNILGVVKALKYYKNVLYIGGYHTNYSDLFAYNVSNNTYFGFNTQFTGIVQDLEITNDSILVVAGEFAGNDYQRNIGAININTKNNAFWPYQTARPVYSLCSVNANTMFHGGKFFTLTTKNQHNLAAININTSQQKNWGYTINRKISALQVVDTNVYIGGEFAYINGKFKPYMGCLHTTDTSKSTWNAAPNQFVNTLALKGDTLYMGGNFTKIGTTNVSFLAAVSRSAQSVHTSWNPNVQASASDGVANILLDGGTLYVTGGFIKVNGQNRNTLAALEANTGALKNFNTSSITTGARVNTIGMWKNRLVCIGIITDYTTNPSRYIGVYDTATGAEITTQINASFNINTVVGTKNNILFIGGLFQLSGGEVRRSIALLNRTTGKVYPWHADIDEEVFDFDVADGKIYYVGFFNNVKGKSRNYIAASYLANDSLLSWNPNLDQYTQRIHIANGRAYIGGGPFTKVNSASRKYFTYIDTGSATAASFQPFSSLTSFINISSIHSYNNKVYVAGRFNSTTGYSRDYLASFDASTDALQAFDAKLSNGAAITQVDQIFNSGNAVYFGGQFAKADTVQAHGFLRANGNTATIDKWAPNSNDIAVPMAQNGDDVYFSLGKSLLNNKCRCFISAIDTGVKKLSPWHPQIELAPVSVGFGKDKIYLGGEFATFNNNINNYLVAAKLEAVEIESPENNNFCVGGVMSIKISTSGKFDSTNKFILVLSDSTGSFNNSLYIDTITTSADSFLYNIPLTFTPKNNYRIKVLSTSPGLQNTDENYINILPYPKANFTIDDPFQCLAKNTFGFSNTSNIPGNVIWDFGDSSKETQQKPFHTYKKDSIFNVKMVLKPLGSGCPLDSITKHAEVLPQPRPTFLINDSVQCNFRDSFAFTNTSTISKGSMKYFWDFGNLKTDTNKNSYTSFIDTGVYTVKLIATSDSSCVDTGKRKVLVINKPKASFTSNSMSQCLAGNNFTFTNTSTPLTNFVLRWNFGDGDTASKSIVNKSFTKDSSFTVKLFVVKDSACFDSTFKVVHVNPQPKPSFAVDTLIKCANDSFSFTNTSTIKKGIITKYNWNFGDGSTSVITNPHHLYDSARSFKVLLTATSDSGCVDTASKNVVANPLPLARFIVNDIVQCFKTQSFVFTNLSIPAIGDSIATYLWDLGDSSSSSLKNPTHIYSDTGYYFVTLKVTGVKGCSDTARLISIVAPEPVIGTIAGPIVVQGTETHTYTIVNDTFTTYYWSVSNGNLVLGPDSASATITWDSVTTTTNAKISIIPVNIAGCIGDTAFLNVQIDPFLIGINNPTINELKIYPNPARKSFYISVNNTDISSGSVEITDALGKVVYSKQYSSLSGNEIEINVSSLPPGIYQVSFGNPHYKAIAKIVLLNE